MSKAEGNKKDMLKIDQLKRGKILRANSQKSFGNSKMIFPVWILIINSAKCFFKLHISVKVYNILALIFAVFVWNSVLMHIYRLVF